MSLTVSTNTSAATAHRYLKTNDMDAARSMAKLSSGSRIVRASDDAASLAVGTKLKADVTALKQAQVNVNQASSVLQVADGGMSQIGDILQRMKALSVQSSSGSVTDTERAYLNEEFTQLRTEIDNIAGQTKFNGQTLLTGAFQASVDATTIGADFATFGIAPRISGNVGAAAQQFQLAYVDASDTGTGTFTLTTGGTDGDITTAGDNYTHTVTVSLTPGVTNVLDDAIEFSEAGITFDLTNFVAGDGVTAGGGSFAASATTGFDVAQAGSLDFQVGTLSSEKISVTIPGLQTADLAIGASTVDTAANAAAASTALDGAVDTLNGARANMGAAMSRLDFVSANLAVSVENLDSARSTLMDVDVAAEMANFSAKQVMMQASVSMMAQANQMPQQLLKLLG